MASFLNKLVGGVQHFLGVNTNGGPQPAQKPIAQQQQPQQPKIDPRALQAAFQMGQQGPSFNSFQNLKAPTPKIYVAPPPPQPAHPAFIDRNYSDAFSHLVGGTLQAIPRGFVRGDTSALQAIGAYHPPTQGITVPGLIGGGQVKTYQQQVKADKARGFSPLAATGIALGSLATDLPGLPGKKKVTEEAASLAKGLKLRSSPETIKNSPVVQANTPITPTDLHKLIDSIPYGPRPQKSVLEQGMKQINANPQVELNKALQPLTNRSDLEAGKRMILIADNLQRGNHEVANEMSKALAPAGTEGGRFIAMFNTINKTTPSGAFHWATKLGADSKTAKGFYDRAVQIAKMPAGDEKLIAHGQLSNDIGRLQPTSGLDKAYGIWRAGLLTGPRTVSKIIASHGVHLPLETAKTVPAAGVDKLVSLISGQRSLALTGRGLGRGLISGAKSGKTFMKTGVNLQGGMGAEFHKTFTYGNSVPGKVTEAYVNGIGRLHGSLYQPFYGAEHLNSLYSQGLAVAKNKSLTGQASNKFVEKFVAKPPKWAADMADQEAQTATFQQKTTLGNLASSLQQRGGIVGKILAPFTRVPSAIATDAFHYSPAGAAKAVIDATKAARSEEGWTLAAQRKFSQEIGRSIVGTGALLPGILLYQKGIITLGYPKNDANQQKLWQLEGKTANSIKIGGKWRSTGSLGPAGTVLEMGGSIGKALSEGQSWGQALISGLGGAAQSVEEQPYVQGVANAVGALQDPGRVLPNIEKSYAKSVIPTGIAQVASSFDKNQRQVNTPTEAIKSAIPGQRQSLPVKNDAFGQPLPSGEIGIGALADPFYSSTARPSAPLTTELQRLQDNNASTMPSTQPQKDTINGQKVTLTKPQAQALQAQIGQTVQPLWNQAIQSPQYQGLTDDTQKHKLLAGILSDTTSIVKGNAAKSLGVASTPTSSKSLTSAQKSLNKTTTQLNYSKQVTDLYGLSKAKMQAALINLPNAQDITAQLKAYDSALLQAGLISKSKFAATAKATSTKSTGIKGTRTSTAKIASLKLKLPPKPKAVKIGKVPSPKAKSIKLKFKTPKLAKVKKTKVKFG